jgi:hypothetical protein
MAAAMSADSAAALLPGIGARGQLWLIGTAPLAHHPMHITRIPGEAGTAKSRLHQGDKP